MLQTNAPTLAQARLRHHVEMQSGIIEETVNAYSPRLTYVTGGDVRADRIWYEMSAIPSGVSMREIEHDLQRRLGAAARVSRGNVGLRVTVERPSPPVDLLTLMQTYNTPPVGALTAVLGLDSLGVPVTWDAAQTGHTLVTGGGIEAKRNLLQTTAVSLALANQPRQIQFLIIKNLTDDRNSWPSQFLTSDYLLRPIVATTAEAVHALSTIAARHTQSPALARKGPRLILMIDQIESLLETAGYAALSPLIQLLGTSSLTLLISAQQPQNDLIRYCDKRWGARIVGQTANAAEAASATGLARSQAERLHDNGAFLFILSGALSARHFQAAAADQYDLSFTAGIIAQSRPRPAQNVPHSLPT